MFSLPSGQSVSEPYNSENVHNKQQRFYEGMKCGIIEQPYCLID